MADPQRACRPLDDRVEVMSGRAISGGFDNRPPASRGIYAPHDSILVPSGNFPLPNSKFTQAMIDIFKLLCAFLLVSATGCGLAFALFVLLFVSL